MNNTLVVQVKSTKPYKKPKRSSLALLLSTVSLFLSFALLISSCSLFSYERYSTRSRNVLDELYYASIDSRCLDAIRHGITEPEVILSVISPFKARPVDEMKNIESWHGGYYSEQTGGIFSDVSEFSKPNIGKATTYNYRLSTPSGDYKASWCADTSVHEDNGAHISKSLSFDVTVPLLVLSNGVYQEYASVQTSFQYALSTNTLFVGSTTAYDSNGMPAEDADKYLASHNTSTSKIKKRSLSFFKRRVLADFINRENGFSAFSTDLENEGVTIKFDCD